LNGSPGLTAAIGYAKSALVDWTSSWRWRPDGMIGSQVPGDEPEVEESTGCEEGDTICAAADGYDRRGPESINVRLAGAESWNDRLRAYGRACSSTTDPPTTPLHEGERLGLSHRLRLGRTRRAGSTSSG
jgi:hypothetical protein